MARERVQIRTLVAAAMGAEKSPTSCQFIIHAPVILMAIADKQSISSLASPAMVASL